MITKTYINNDMTVLKNFLEQLVPEYFASVEYDADRTVTVKDSDGNTIFKIAKHKNGTSLDGYDVTAYNHLGTGAQAVYWYGTSNYGHMYYGYKAANGALIPINPSNTSTVEISRSILITKNQNGETVFVYSYSTSSQSVGDIHLTDVCAVTWNDASPLTRFAFSTNTKNQTLFVPFPTVADSGEISYTPNAGYFAAGQNYSMGMGSIIMDGYVYLTNGYWAIKDEAV